MVSVIKLLLTAAVYFTTSGGLLIGSFALPTASAVETTVAVRDVNDPNDSMTECGFTMALLSANNEHDVLLPSFHYLTTSCAQHDKECWNNKSTTLVNSPSTQLKTLSGNPFSSVTTTSSVSLKTNHAVERVEYIVVGRRPTKGSTARKTHGKSFQEIDHEYQVKRNEKLWHNTILAEYREAFNRIVEWLTLFKNNTKRYFTVVQGSGQRALVVTKLEAIKFYKTSSSAMQGVSDVIAAYKTATMGFYNFANGFALMNRRSSMAGYYEDAFTVVGERLTRFKNKTMGCFPIVHGLIQQALIVTKGEAMELYKTFTSAIARTGGIVSTSKTPMMGFYNLAQGSSHQVSNLVKRAFVVAKHEAMEFYRMSSNAIGHTVIIFSAYKPTMMGFCNRAKSFASRNISILAGYNHLLFTSASEHFAAFSKNATMRYFRMKHELGQKALSITKRKVIDFYEMSFSTIRRVCNSIVSACNQTMVRFYNRAKGSACRKSTRSKWDGYKDVTTRAREHLIAFKDATMRCVRRVHGLGQDAVSLTKRKALEFYKRSSSALGCTGGHNDTSDSKPTVTGFRASFATSKHAMMGWYDWVNGLIARGHWVVTTHSVEQTNAEPISWPNAINHWRSLQHAMMRFYNRAKGSTDRKSSKLAGYKDVTTRATEHLTAFKDATMRCVRMVHGLGQEADSLTKRKALEFYKRSSSILGCTGGDNDTSDSKSTVTGFRGLFAASNHALMGWYDWANGLILRVQYGVTTYSVEQINAEPISWPNASNLQHGVNMKFWELTSQANSEAFKELAYRSTGYLLLLGALGWMCVRTKLSQYDATPTLEHDHVDGPLFQAHPY